MNEYDDLGQYTGDQTHDMNVDFDYHNNTGFLSDFFDNEPDDDISDDEFISLDEE